MQKFVSETFPQILKSRFQVCLTSNLNSVNGGMACLLSISKTVSASDRSATVKRARLVQQMWRTQQANSMKPNRRSQFEEIRGLRLIDVHLCW